MQHVERDPVAGRRERKKQQTRAHIAETARGLFGARGFDAVSVVEIAHEADVSEQTVYNHFATKEDLVYWRSDEFEVELLDAVRARGPGEDVLEAVGRFIREPRGLLITDDRMARQKLTRLMHVIAGSASLRAREQTIIAGYTASLAHLIAEEVGVRDETEAWVVSGALLAVHRMLIDAARQQVLDGVDPTAIARAHTARADRALSLLADGLRGYAVRPSRSRARRTRR